MRPTQPQAEGQRCLPLQASQPISCSFPPAHPDGSVVVGVHEAHKLQYLLVTQQATQLRACKAGEGGGRENGAVAGVRLRATVDAHKCTSVPASRAPGERRRHLGRPLRPLASAIVVLSSATLISPLPSWGKVVEGPAGLSCALARACAPHGGVARLERPPASRCPPSTDSAAPPSAEASAACACGAHLVEKLKGSD